MRCGSLLLALLLPVAPPGTLAAQDPAACPATVEREEFSEFIRRFDRDSAFQLSRIRYPLPGFSQALDAERTLAPGQWEYAPLLGDGETYLRVFDDYAMTERDTDERVLALIGIASDVRQDYYFRRLCGRCFLVRWDDFSV